MTATEHAPDDVMDSRRCGCCGRTLPPERLVELGDTPRVYICRGCALWAARRAHGPVLRPDLRSWMRRRSRRSRRSGMMRSAIPVLPSDDLHHAAKFYATLGFTATGRYPGYLVLNAESVELHLTDQAEIGRPGQCFVHVADATALWKRLKAADARGLTGPSEHDGLVEFTVTDPDANQVRFGSPAL